MEQMPTRTTKKNIDVHGRRTFLKMVLGLFGATGAVAGVPVIRMLAPSKDVEAQRFSKIDLTNIKEGELFLGEWQGKPLFVLHRDKKMIESAQASDGLKDPEPDAKRVQKPEWLIVLGVCTHLGCTPSYKPEDPEIPGWLCPCHGSRYDFSARIIKGPAPRNLDVPPYKFNSDTEIIVG